MIRDAMRAWMNKQLQAIMNPGQGGSSGGGQGGNILSAIWTGISNMVWGGSGGPGYAMGGYTGPGGLFQPAGVVHKGEVVFSQADVAKAGGVGAVEAMRRGGGRGMTINQTINVPKNTSYETAAQAGAAAYAGVSRAARRNG
jgi:phage-related minor tail protein